MQPDFRAFWPSLSIPKANYNPPKKEDVKVQVKQDLHNIKQQSIWWPQVPTFANLTGQQPMPWVTPQQKPIQPTQPKSATFNDVAKSFSNDMSNRRNGDKSVSKDISERNKGAYTLKALSDMRKDIDNGADEESIKGAYKDIPQDIILWLYDDIKNWHKIWDIMKAYPELDKIQEIDPQWSRFSQVEDGETNILGIPKIPRFDKFADPQSGGARDTILWFGENLLKSWVNLVSDVWNVVLDPVDTVTNIAKLWAWALWNASDMVAWSTEPKSENQKMASQVADYFANRYGSMEWFQEASYKDPVWVFSDIASLISWGAWAIAKGTTTLWRLWKVGEVSKIAETAGDIARWFNKVDPGAVIMWKAWELAGKWLKETGRAIRNTASKLPETNIGKSVSNTYNKFVENYEWFSKAQKKSRQNNPKTKELVEPVLKRIDEQWLPENIQELATPEYTKVSSELENKIKDRMKVIGENGDIYNTLRKDKTPIESKWILADMSKVLKGTDFTVKSFLKRVDPWNLLWTRKIFDETTDIATLHDIRKWIDDLKKKAWANKDSGEYRVLSDMRDIIDSKMKENPNRAKNDSLFSKERAELKKLTENLVYKDKNRLWEMKDNIDNIIKNINNPAKRRIKDRLVELIPDIEERVDAINQIVPIAKAYTTTPKWVVWKALGTLWWSIAWFSVGWYWWAIAGGILWIIWESVLSSNRQKIIRNAIATQSPEALKRMDELMKIVNKWEKLRKSQVDEIRSFSKEVKESIPKTQEKLKKEVDKATTAIILKSEWPLQKWTSKDIFVAWEKWIKKGTITDKGVETKRTVTELDPQGKEYRQPDFNLEEYNKISKSADLEFIKKNSDKIEPRLIKEWDYTDQWVVEKLWYDWSWAGTRPYWIIDWKKVYVTDIKEAYRPWKKINDMIDETMDNIPSSNKSRLDDMQMWVARQSQISYIEEQIGKKVSELDKNSKDIIYRLINNRKLQADESVMQSIFDIMKKWEVDSDTFNIVNDYFDDIMKK